MQKHEIAKLFDKIACFYPAFGCDPDKAMDKINAWHEALTTVSLEQAVINLKKYVTDSDSKYPPHPGVLARPLDMKTDSERYHDHMKENGEHTLQKLGVMKAEAVGPTEEQRRRVRELYEKSI